MKEMRRVIRELTDRRWLRIKDVREVISRLNPLLRGWGNYFRTGNASERFQEIDHHLWVASQPPDEGSQGPTPEGGDSAKWSHKFFWSLEATPSARHHPLPWSCAMPRPERSSVSRVRENRTHGSNGGLLLSSIGASAPGRR
ncbi:MAG: group II intron maturase-specific domain-containing protein [Myxococcota bacterium]